MCVALHRSRGEFFSASVQLPTPPTWAPNTGVSVGDFLTVVWESSFPDYTSFSVLLKRQSSELSLYLGEDFTVPSGQESYSFSIDREAVIALVCILLLIILSSGLTYLAFFREVAGMTSRLSFGTLWVMHPMATSKPPHSPLAPLV